MEDMERLKFWKGKRVLVTGATGVIGLNLVERLIKLHASVVALVRDAVPQVSLLPRNVVIVRGELEDYNCIARTLAEYEIEYVFHLGAQTIVGVGNRSPLTTFRANIEGTWNLLEAVRVMNSDIPSGVRCVCIASSDKAYGDSQRLPYTEDMPLHGRHPYDTSKSCADLLAQCYAHTYDNVPTCIARMGNVYGPCDLNFNRVVPGTIKALVQDERPVIISDGTPVREYFYVGDAVGAYLTMAENIEGEGLYGEAFNFSSGEKMSVLDLVNKIINLYGSDVEPKILNTNRKEIQEQYLSTEKAERHLGWFPKHSVEEGLKLTIPWYKEWLSHD